MAINRALFNMIDTKTGQLYEDRRQREKILRHHFERDFTVEDEIKTLEFTESELIRIENEQEAHFSWNDFNPRKRLVLFDLSQMINSFDSLFLYTNINLINSILVCKVNDIFCDFFAIINFHIRNLTVLFIN